MSKKNYDLPDSPFSVGFVDAKKRVLATEDNPFKTESGKELDYVEVEYECYGKLNGACDNAVLITHALSGDAHTAGWDRNSDRDWRKDRPGWWDAVVGPNKAIDTNKFFVICSNVLGSCYGTTGPASINPKSGKPYGTDFPIVTIGDWVALQKRLIDSFGISKLYAVVGGSLGGQQALEWALAFPDMVEKTIILASASRLSTQGVAFNAVGRHSIINDKNYNDGDYYGKEPPETGLAAARMLAHITYLSEESMYEKFGRKFQNSNSKNYNFGIEYKVESYLDYQGKNFVKRFDANSYLYITKAMDYYDAGEKWGNGNLLSALERIKSNNLIISFSSDWLYTYQQSLDLAKNLSMLGKSVSFVAVDSIKGHDAFLVETDMVSKYVKPFLEA